MATDDASLYIGEVDFATPTLLILGNASSLLKLADLVEQRIAGRLDDLAHAVRLKDIDLRITHTDQESALRRGGKVFEWIISSSDARKFAEQLRGLAVSRGAAHAYLDPLANDAGVEILASKDEYDPTAVFKDEDSGTDH